MKGMLCMKRLLEVWRLKIKKPGCPTKKEGETTKDDMNIVSYNIRGCSNLMKHRRLSLLLDKGKADICFIHEIKIQNI